MTRRALALLIAVLVAVPCEAQTRAPRPKLQAGADTNDWEPYFDLGVRLLRADVRAADDAFTWASRLNPERAEPLFARWVTFHAQDNKRFQRYLANNPKVLAQPEVEAADSLARLAYIRNPFVYRSLEVVLYDLTGGWGRDDVSQGWAYYAEPDPPRAVRFFGRAIEKDPVGWLWLSPLRAQAFVAMAKLDSALVEMERLRNGLAKQEGKRTRSMAYDSKAFIEYAEGLLFSALHRPDSARIAMQRALVEDVSYWPARLYLATDALQRAQVDAALLELDQAVLVAPNDPVLLLQLARTYVRAARGDDAVATAERLTALAPDWASAWLALGQARERRGDFPGAAVAFRQALQRGARTDPARVEAERAVARLVEHR